MASIAPLNEFKSLPYDVTTSPTIIYTTPIAVATIVLKIQVANVSTDTENISAVTVSHVRGTKRTRVIYNAPVLANDFSIVSDGKFVLQEGDSLEVSGNANSTLEMIVSYLETSA
jgi:limonene-1,2-epoxide hydrolase